MSESINYIPGKVFLTLEKRCKDASINLTAICDDAGVHTSKVWRWKNSEPSAFETLARLNAAIDKAIEEKHGK